MLCFVIRIWLVCMLDTLVHSVSPGSPISRWTIPGSRSHLSLLSSKTSHGSLVHIEQKAISLVWKYSKPAKFRKRRLFLKNQNETHDLKAKSTKRFIKKYNSLWFYPSQQLQSCYSGPTIFIFLIDLFW